MVLDLAPAATLLPPLLTAVREKERERERERERAGSCRLYELFVSSLYVGTGSSYGSGSGSGSAPGFWSGKYKQCMLELCNYTGLNCCSEHINIGT